MKYSLFLVLMSVAISVAYATPCDEKDMNRLSQIKSEIQKIESIAANMANEMLALEVCRREPQKREMIEAHRPSIWRLSRPQDIVVKHGWDG